MAVDPMRLESVWQGLCRPPVRAVWPSFRPPAAACLAGALIGGGHAAEPRLADLLDEAASHRRSLAEFVGTAGALAIQGTTSGIEIEIGISPRIEATEGEVVVCHEEAAEPGRGRTRLKIFWDEAEIGAGSLADGERFGQVMGRFRGAEDPVSSYRLKVVAELPGPLPAETTPHPLLSQIDPTRSWIAMKYQLRPLQPMLDELRDLIDERFWGDYDLTIVTAPLYSLSDSHWTWGNWVSQRAALWMGERPLRIRHSDQLAGRGDEIAIGTRSDLIGILPKTICDQITSSFVGIYPHPRDDRRFLLVLSGTEAEGVERAVRAFAFAPEKMPPLPRIDVTGWPVHPLPPRERAGTSPGHLVLPDLARWRSEGFALPGGPDQPGGASLWITRRDSPTVATAWMLAGKLAQVAGDLDPDLRVADSKPFPSGRHWMAIGPMASLDPVLLQASPASRVSPGEGDGLLAQFESPYGTGWAGGLLTAADSLLLHDRVVELIQPGCWNGLHGDTVVWSDGGGSVRHQRLAGTFEVGRPGALLSAWRWLSSLPWLSIVLSGIGAGILAWLLWQPMTSGRDWDLVPARSHANRRVSRARRLREVARRQARLDEAVRRSA